MRNAENILYEFLVESNFMSYDEFDSLTESAKMEDIKELTKEILNNILSRLSSIDTLPIDKSRGDIRQFSGLEYIQEAVKTILMVIRKYDDGYSKKAIPQEVFGSLEQIMIGIKNLSAKSNEFKEAYRNKKTLMMLEYQSIVIAIITELSYIISSVIDVKNGTVDVKNKIDYTPSNFVDVISNFNKKVNNGEFAKISHDVQLVREFYSEVSDHYSNTILESGDIMSMIIDGIKSFYSSMDSKGRLTGLIYKAAGVVALIMSLRSAFYTLYRCSNKVGDSLNNIKNFVNFEKLPNNNSVNKFISYNNKNKKDVEFASNTATQEISKENKEIALEVKSAPSTIPELEPVEVAASSHEEPSLESEFKIDF